MLVEKGIGTALNASLQAGRQRPRPANDPTPSLALSAALLLSKALHGGPPPGAIPSNAAVAVNRPSASEGGAEH